MDIYASAVHAPERDAMPSIDTAEALVVALKASPAWLATASARWIFPTW